ncbi:hypothetical protein ACFS07_28265 [Undibacterium arcticum]
MTGVQKVHGHAVPRIGGLAIFLSVVVTGAGTIWREPFIGKPIVFFLLLCSSVAFAGGIVEDYTKRVSPWRRLVLTMIAAVLGYFFFWMRG